MDTGFRFCRLKKTLSDCINLENCKRTEKKTNHFDKFTLFHYTVATVFNFIVVAISFCFFLPKNFIIQCL